MGQAVTNAANTTHDDVPLLSHRRTRKARESDAHEPDDANPASTQPQHRHPRAYFIIGKGGGGHSAAARAVRDAVAANHPPCAEQIELLYGADIMEPILRGSAPFASLLPKIDPDAWYNWLMSIGFYRCADLIGYLGNKYVRLQNRKLIDGLAKEMTRRQPLLVVNFLPYFSDALRSALLRACPDRHFITVITDMSATPGHPWMVRFDDTSANELVVTGTPHLERQAVEMGFPPEHIMRVSGMVVNPVFYEKSHAAAPAARDAAPRALIFFGGVAPPRVAQIATKLRRSHPLLHLTIICGSNEALQKSLAAALGDECVVEGLVAATTVRDLLQTSTLVIGKPGPGVVAEAGVCRVPFVTDRENVMSQELSVLDYIENEGVGIVVDSLENLPPDLLERCERCQKYLLRCDNRAVFEVSAKVIELIRDANPEVDSP